MAVPNLVFKRGASFRIAFSLPSNIEDGFFENWQIKGQIRKKLNDMPSGMIAQLNCAWEDALQSKVIFVWHDATELWPICEAELDLLFTSPDGNTLRSKTINISIERGITNNV